jgi:hypothetical protein
LTINLLLFMLLWAIEPQQYVQRHCMFWYVNAAVTVQPQHTCNATACSDTWMLQ